MGAYSELDAALREGYDDFAEDDTFAEDEGQYVPPPGSTSNVLRAEPVSAPPAQPVEPEPAPVAPQQPKPVEPQAAAPAQSGDNEDAKRKAHEEAEAKRKAEWQAKRKQKKAEEKLKLAQIENMSNDEVLAEALKRVGEDTEKLTRRHMMECVMEHIQTLCLTDPAFARKVMHPRKNMIRCCQYIGRKAWEYVQDELKAKGITPSRENPYGSAIPEGVCYQWAVDYFNTPDVKEDVEKEEKFVPKPYRGTSAATSKPAADKGGTTVKDAAPKEAEHAAPKKRDDNEQISFGDFVMPEVKAG